MVHSLGTNDPVCMPVVDFYEACILRVPLGDLLASPVNKSVGHIFGQIMKSGTVMLFVVLIFFKSPNEMENMRFAVKFVDLVDASSSFRSST